MGESLSERSAGASTPTYLPTYLCSNCVSYTAAYDLSEEKLIIII
jgi:hypothetical protein